MLRYMPPPISLGLLDFTTKGVDQYITMPDGRDGSESLTYRPTSLDFINLPNPIEPYAGSQKHPLNGTPRLEKARLDGSSNQDLFKLILESSHASQSHPIPEYRSPKRRKAAETALLDLPKLPVRQSAKRLRIPPTLSGLHQPPPDAGLLPSISVDQPQPPPPRHNAPGLNVEAVPKPSASSATDEPITNESEIFSSTPRHPKKRGKRNIWSNDETNYLLKGVARFGIGSWTKILNCSDYQFNQRTALDLKDRFRVCCPDEYGPKTSETSKMDMLESEATDKAGSTKVSKVCATTNPKGPAPQRISSHKLKNLGIDKPFVRTARRQRHGYNAAEDEALLRGYEKHGNSWAAIRHDESLGLSHRKPTDLRDRFRTRYPEAYARTGMPSRNEKSANTTQDGTDMAPKTAGTFGNTSIAEITDSATQTNTSTSFGTSTTDESTILKSASGKQNSRSKFFSLDDVFLGVPFDTDGYADGSEPVVLDRGILDWAANDTSRPVPLEAAKTSGIDPLMTLNLPRPVFRPPSSTVSGVPMSGYTNTSTALPSFAALVSSGSTNPEQAEQMELPSLVQWYGGSENEYKQGLGNHNFPILDDLLG